MQNVQKPDLIVTILKSFNFAYIRLCFVCAYIYTYIVCNI